MSPLPRPLAVLVALLLAATAVAEERAARTYAVRTGEDAVDLAAAVSSGSFQRWYVPNNDDVHLVVGPGVDGDVEIEAQLFPADDRLRRRLEGLPVRVQGDGIAVGGTLYPNRGHALALRIPGTSGSSSWAVIGYDARTVASLVDQVLWSSTGRRFRRGSPDVDYLLWEHRFSHRSGRWRHTEGGIAVDPEERDDIAARAALYTALEAVERPHVVLRVPPGYSADPRARRLADELESTARTLAPQVAVTLERPLEVLVERDFVEMGRHLANIGATVLDDDGRVHLVYHEEDFDAYRYGLARALVRRAGLELPPRLEDGAALWLSRRWYGRAYADWLPDLAFARVLPTPQEVFADGSRANRSDVLWPPVTAALVERLPGETLRDKLARLPSSGQVAEVLRRIEKESSAVPPAAHPKRAGLSVRAGFQNGISLAMRNGLEVGYHAPGVDEQLARLSRLGADSISLMPFTGQSAPDKPEMRLFNGGPSSETDAGMIHAARQAHDRGIRVLWKPHIWVSHDSWPGDIAMTSEEDWAAWWRDYRRFTLRHAVLAEWTGSALFSVGVELGKTLQREAEWRHLIRSVRRVYSGQVTYCGNWWGDYERVPFWGELDYVGVDAYFPLDHRSDADRRALEAGARRAVDQLRAAAERFGKPVLLTEVGFSARKGTWVSPHEEGGELSEEHQTLAYRALLEALGRPPWLAGVYLWKAFSHPSVEGGERPDFQFLGRRAESVVRSYFRSASPAVIPTAQR